MIAAVKRLVGVDRAQPGAVDKLDREALEKPVEKARQRLDAAQEAHQASLARVADVAAEIRTAEAALDAERTDQNADRVLDLERDRHRAEKLRASTQRTLEQAQAELAKAKAERDQVLADHLRLRVASAPRRAEELWAARGRPGLQALAAFLDELDELIGDARAAAIESNRGDTIQQQATAMGVDGIRGIVRELASKDVSPAALLRIERLVG